MAFAVALNQNKELIGERGLLPVKLYMERIKSHFSKDRVRQFLTAPTLLWLWEPWDEGLDEALDGLATAGLALSAAVLVTGAANAVSMITLWVLYHSVVNVGQRWYSFGWESQLLETGFLAVWAVPWYCWTRFPVDTPSPWVAKIGYRWLITRIMIGAGLIKVRGDKCWTDFSCMDYFFETQPNPSPVSYFAHHAPRGWHRFEVFGNHVVELVFPFLAFLPFRWAALTNGFFQILFQVVLISTGNLSFLNWLTIVPSIWFFDDAFWARFFSNETVQRAKIAEAKRKSSKKPDLLRRAVNLAVAGAIAYLSIPIVVNLANPNQIMNTSFEPFRIVNTYGAFGSVTKTRTELIFEGTHDTYPNTATWEEYEFKCKPGNVTRAPCLISPYHYRLDWLMWFAAFQDYQSNPWLLRLAGKMLENDPVVDSLLQRNPFAGRDPPKLVRISHYKYNFVKLGGKSAKDGKWWRRKFMKNYLPPMNRASLEGIYGQFGWAWP